MEGVAIVEAIAASWGGAPVTEVLDRLERDAPRTAATLRRSYLVHRGRVTPRPFRRLVTHV